MEDKVDKRKITFLKELKSLLDKHQATIRSTVEMVYVAGFYVYIEPSIPFTDDGLEHSPCHTEIDPETVSEMIYLFRTR